MPRPPTGPVRPRPRARRRAGSTSPSPGEQLARMRERTAAMDASAAGDWVSREFLESTFALRMKQLADDPTIPLFFGRLDYADGERRLPHRPAPHLRRAGEPMVIDWRAPVSLPFYRASRAEPMGVELRRRYGFQHGGSPRTRTRTSRPARSEYSAILEAEIERPRVGPMRDIVATIQPEQDVIVRSELSRSVCVQGAPGTGKTAVGLHRAAYLLYAHREQLTRQGVLVVGPNASFLRYIRDVLPALGEIDATQSTIGELAARTLRGRPAVAVRGEDAAAVADAQGRRPAGRGAARARSGPTCRRRPRACGAARLAALAGRGVRGRGVVAVAARARGAVRRGARDAAAVAGAPGAGARWSWPASRPTTGCRTRSPAASRSRTTRRDCGRRSTRPGWCGGCCRTPTFLAERADGLLDRRRAGAAAWPRPPRSPGRRAWSLADAVLVDEAADLVERDAVGWRTSCADEAQDLSPMMLRALGPASLDRLADRARRPGAGHDALGDRGPGPRRWATSASRTRTSSSSPAGSGCPAR